MGCGTRQLDEDIHDALAHSPGGLQSLAALSLSGANLASARVARRCVRGMAQLKDLPSSTVDDLETVTGELVANALEHSDSHAITVTLALTAETATVSVTDEGEKHRPMGPAPVGPDPEEHGRGLLIIDALAARWGRRRTNNGLTVWAKVATNTLNRVG
ncbi:ATP-binding protein [Streptomyces sp. B21-083]